MSIKDQVIFNFNKFCFQKPLGQFQLSMAQSMGGPQGIQYFCPNEDPLPSRNENNYNVIHITLCIFNFNQLAINP